ncbi:MAG: dihydropyrimidinase [Negativicutes bacterium]|nr:dihydropyrimidinase [Negativicutes bacterium]
MTTYDLLLKGGTIVTASDVYAGDIAVLDGKVALIGQALDVPAGQVIDATGKYLLPGGIDVHTHLDMPFGGTVTADNFFTGGAAAACGGTTTVVDFAIQGKGQTLAQTIDTWLAKAADCPIDYGLHVAVTDMNEAVLAEMPKTIAAGFPSFKLFMTYDGLRVTDDVLMKALLAAKQHGGLVSVHAENYYVIDYYTKEFEKTGKVEPKYHALSRPPLAEGEATARAIRMAKLVEAPLYIVHLSCEDALREVARARDEGLPVMAETCPQYLVLSYDNYEEPGFNGAKYVMSPPLRPRENQAPLWQGLKKGDLQVVATDHCSFNFKGQKELGREFFGKIPNGAPGIETRLAVLYSSGVGQGRIDLQRFAAITATNPAKIFGLYPQKGTIAVGSDADIVVFDPQARRTISTDILHENVDYTAYEGFAATGYPVATVARGRLIAADGKFTGAAGSGKLIKRKKPQII